MKTLSTLIIELKTRMENGDYQAGANGPVLLEHDLDEILSAAQELEEAHEMIDNDVE